MRNQFSSAFLYILFGFSVSFAFNFFKIAMLDFTRGLEHQDEPLSLNDQINQFIVANTLDTAYIIAHCVSAILICIGVYLLYRAVVDPYPYNSMKYKISHIDIELEDKHIELENQNIVIVANLIEPISHLPLNGNVKLPRLSY